MASLLEKSVVSPTLIGWAERLAALGRGLAAALDGHGQTVLLSGDTGVGKTRLAAETGAKATQLGWRCFKAVAWSRIDPSRMGRSLTSCAVT